MRLLRSKKRISYKEVGGRDLTLDEFRTTLAFKENQEWVERLLKEGYTFLDMGDPHGLGIEESAAYMMEQILVFERVHP